MGNGSIGKTTSHEFPSPRILGWGNGPLFPILRNEPFDELKRRLTVNLIPALIVRVGYRQAPTLAGSFDPGSQGIRGAVVFSLDCLHGVKSGRFQGELTGNRGGNGHRVRPHNLPCNMRATFPRIARSVNTRKRNPRSKGRHPRFLTWWMRIGGSSFWRFSLVESGVNRPAEPTVSRGFSRRIQASMKCRFPVPCAAMKMARWPERAPAQARQSAQGIPARSLAHRVSMVW